MTVGMQRLSLLFFAAVSAGPAEQNSWQADGLACSKITSNSMTLSWPVVPSTDMYYVAISGEEGDGIHDGRPFAIRTSASNSVALIDLMPSTKCPCTRTRKHALQRTDTHARTHARPTDR